MVIFFSGCTFCFQLVAEETEAPKQGSSADPTVWLDRLAAIFRYQLLSTFKLKFAVLVPDKMTNILKKIFLLFHLKNICCGY